MNLQELKRMVSKGENSQVEFKRKATYPEKIMKEVVAFANSKGGHLLIGVDDNRSIPGLKFVKEEEFVMNKSLDELCWPPIKYELDKIEIGNNRTVLHYFIPPGDKKPYYTFRKKNHKYGKAYIRVEDKSIQASKEIRKVLQLKEGNNPVKFSYGDNEKKLMNYLGEHEWITLNQYKEIAQLSRNKASEILVTMSLSNVLKIEPRESGDRFIYAK